MKLTISLIIPTYNEEKNVNIILSSYDEISKGVYKEKSSKKKRRLIRCKRIKMNKK